MSKHLHILGSISLIFVITLVTACGVISRDKFVNHSMQVAKQQAVLMADHMNRYPDKLPRTYDLNTDSIFIADSKHWVSGFYPGTLWYLYEYHKNQQFKDMAVGFLSRVEKEKYNTYDHDIGFQIYCSFGNAYRLTKNTTYKEVILTAAQSATKRFNEKIGLIRSWDFGREKWQYPVIIDNMMNLELLMQAFHHTGDSLYYQVAVSHADNTMKHHFRPDYSCYHVVSYDTITRLPHGKMTHQGAFDESHWARGQAWALYGFTMMYRETGFQKYLTHAVNIANYLIHHPNMPKDMIPYWDLLSTDIPTTYRDASAAAIMASALIELSGSVDTKQKSEYLRVANIQLKTLSGPEYLAKPGTNGYFILKHSVGNMPRGHEVDAPLSYADYYFLEALIRYSNL